MPQYTKLFCLNEALQHEAFKGLLIVIVVPRKCSCSGPQGGKKCHLCCGGRGDLHERVCTPFTAVIWL